MSLFSPGIRRVTLPWLSQWKQFKDFQFGCHLQRKLLSDLTILENSAQDSRFKVFWSSLYGRDEDFGALQLWSAPFSLFSIRINFNLLQIILICKTVQYVKRNSPQLSWLFFSTANFGFQPWPHQTKPSCTRVLLIAPLEGKGIYMEMFGLNRAHPNLTLGARLGILLMHLVQVHLGKTIQLEDLGISAAHTPSSQCNRHTCHRHKHTHIFALWRKNEKKHCFVIQKTTQHITNTLDSTQLHSHNNRETS